MPAIRVAAPALVMALVLLAIALLVLNFKAARSETQNHASVGTASTSPSEAPSTPPPLFLHVDGDGSLAAALRDALQTELDGGAYFAGVTMLDGPPGADDHPALSVGIDKEDVLWTPFFGRATLVTRFSYASDRGDISWREEGEFVIGDAATVQSRGQVQTVDQTWGVISRPAYLDHLAQAAANQVAAQLAQALDSTSRR